MTFRELNLSQGDSLSSILDHYYGWDALGECLREYFFTMREQRAQAAEYERDAFGW